MLSIFSVLNETVATVSFSAPTHLSHVNCLPAQTTFTATVTRTQVGQHVARRWTNNADQR